MDGIAQASRRRGQNRFQQLRVKAMSEQSTAYAKAEALRSDLGKTPRGLIIDGKSVQAQSGKTFATVNPATGQEICQVAEGGVADVDLAVKAARKALVDPSWRDMSAVDRSKLLIKEALPVEHRPMNRFG